jgi:hypothetical protein
MPFLRRTGFSDGVDAFDFSVPGVTSISCDTVCATYHMSLPSLPSSGPHSRRTHPKKGDVDGRGGRDTGEDQQRL